MWSMAAFSGLISGHFGSLVKQKSTRAFLLKRVIADIMKLEFFLVSNKLLNIQNISDILDISDNN